MPFDPTKPQENTPLDAAEMRNQLNGLNDNVNAVANSVWPQFQSFLTSDDLHDTIVGLSANNVDGIQPLMLTISNPPTQAQVQMVLNKLNEVIVGMKH